MKKLLTLLFVGGLSLACITTISASTSISISFTSTSAKFQSDSRPYLGDHEIRCTYYYENIHGKQGKVKGMGKSSNAVLCQKTLKVPDENAYKSKSAEMTALFNDYYAGSMSKKYGK